VCLTRTGFSLVNTIQTDSHFLRIDVGLERLRDLANIEISSPELLMDVVCDFGMTLTATKQFTAIAADAPPPPPPAKLLDTRSSAQLLRSDLPPTDDSWKYERTEGGKKFP